MRKDNKTVVILDETAIPGTDYVLEVGDVIDFSGSLIEVIDADRRCTNNVLLSFGICRSEPAMDLQQTIRPLEEAFGKKNIVEYPPFFVFKDLPTDVALKYKNPPRKSVREFALEYTKGHFVVFVDQHAIAVHDGIIIDTEKKGFSQKKLEWVYEVVNNDETIEKAVEMYKDMRPRNVFDKPRKRIRRTKGLADLQDELSSRGYDVSIRYLYKILSRNKIGKVIPREQEVRLTDNEVDQVADSYVNAVG